VTPESSGPSGSLDGFPAPPGSGRSDSFEVAPQDSAEAVPSGSFDDGVFASHLEAEGLSAGAAADAARRLAHALAMAHAEIEGSPDGGGAAGFFVPGRIEVLGKHTDYAGGRSLVATMEAGISAVVVGDDAPRIRVIDADLDARVDLLLPHEDEVSSDDAPSPEVPTGWARYPHTWLRRLAEDAPGLGIGFPGGAVVVLSSSLPRAAGMSSSTALLVALHLALATRWRWAESERYRRRLGTREALADYLAAVEAGRPAPGLPADMREAGDPSAQAQAGDPGEGRPDAPSESRTGSSPQAGIDTRGGSQDHFAILCGRPGRLVRCAFHPTRFEAELALPRGWTFALAVSGVSAPKAEESRLAYHQLSAQADAIGEIWSAHASGFGQGSPGAFLDAPPGLLVELGAALARSRHPDFPGEALVRRARQFMEECTTHIPGAHEALLQGAVDAFGQHVARSHQAARESLRNDTPETEALTSLAREMGAPAASPFGAGFGGSVWALVPDEQSADFLVRWREGYLEAFPDREESSRFLRSRPGPPALRVF
jgi:galactokinase